MTEPLQVCDSEFFFLPGSQGQLFATLRRPAEGQRCHSAVLCIMPLMEEMNRCRRLVAEQARALASHGVAVLAIDPYGCGDSEGEFFDANWSTWVDDLRKAHVWLHETFNLPAGVWAIRQGALLAAAAFSEAQLSRLVLWQPVLSGAAALRELLRVSVASSMLHGSGERLTVDTLRSTVLGGEPIDVGGYEVNTGLAAALEGATLNPWPLSAQSILWLDIIPEGSEDSQPPPDLPSGLGQVNTKDVTYVAVPGRRFWSSPDVFANEQLILETRRFFSSETDST